LNRLLRGVGGRITLSLLDHNDEPLTAEGDVVVSIADGAGTTVVSEGVATAEGDGHVFEVPASTAEQLDTYKAIWTVSIAGDVKTYSTHYQVVGAFLCSRTKIRSLDEELDDLVKYPASKVDEARESAEELLESEIGMALRPKGIRTTVDGSGKELLLLNGPDGRPLWKPTKLISVTVDGEALGSEELDEIGLHDWGALQRPERKGWPKGSRNIQLHLEYGLAEPPATVSDACATLAAYYLKPTAIPQRATSVSSSDDTFRLVTADKQGPTGIPSVDALIHAMRYDHPAIG